MEHSTEEVWKASCDHRWTATESPQGQSRPLETSQLKRSDQFLGYCFKLCERAQRVQAD